MHLNTLRTVQLYLVKCSELRQNHRHRRGRVEETVGVNFDPRSGQPSSWILLSAVNCGWLSCRLHRPTFRHDETLNFSREKCIAKCHEWYLKWHICCVRALDQQPWRILSPGNVPKHFDPKALETGDSSAKLTKWAFLGNRQKSLIPGSCRYGIGLWVHMNAFMAMAQYWLRQLSGLKAWRSKLCWIAYSLWWPDSRLGIQKYILPAASMTGKRALPSITELFTMAWNASNGCLL